MDKEVEFRGKLEDFFDVGPEIGKGRFAKVRVVRRKRDGEEFCGKFQNKRRSQKHFKQEIHTHTVCSPHPRFPTLEGVYHSQAEVVIVMQYARGGEMYPYCVGSDLEPDGTECDGGSPVRGLEEDDQQVFSENDVIRYTVQLLEALQFLHSHNILHLDIKPQNMLLSEAYPRGDLLLGDFGLSRPVDTSGQQRVFQGTPDYQAPELVNFDPVSTATDIWSVGVVCYIMLSGLSPFAPHPDPDSDNNNNNNNSSESGGGNSSEDSDSANVTSDSSELDTSTNICLVRYYFPSDPFDLVSPQAKLFISSIFKKQPKQRPSIATLLNHPWLQDGPQLSQNHQKETSPQYSDSKEDNTSSETTKGNEDNQASQFHNLSASSPSQALTGSRSIISTGKELYPDVSPIQTQKNDNVRPSQISTKNKENMEKPLKGEIRDENSAQDSNNTWQNTSMPCSLSADAISRCSYCRQLMLATCASSDQSQKCHKSLSRRTCRVSGGTEEQSSSSDSAIGLSDEEQCRVSPTQKHATEAMSCLENKRSKGCEKTEQSMADEAEKGTGSRLTDFRRLSFRSRRRIYSSK